MRRSMPAAIRPIRALARKMPAIVTSNADTRRGQPLSAPIAPGSMTRSIACHTPSTAPTRWSPMRAPIAVSTTAVTRMTATVTAAIHATTMNGPRDRVLSSR